MDATIERFTLGITLGNDAMQTAEDIAAALESVAATLRDAGGFDEFAGGGIRDLNGDVVGSWMVDER